MAVAVFGRYCLVAAPGAQKSAYRFKASGFAEQQGCRVEWGGVGPLLVDHAFVKAPEGRRLQFGA